MWLYQVPSTGCRCGLRFLSGLLINSVCVSECVRARARGRERASSECSEEERNFSFNFPQLQILHPRAHCFYWNRELKKNNKKKNPASVYDALKGGGAVECGIVNLYIWLRIPQAEFIRL